MTNKSHRKAKTININLTEEEYKKVKVLAEDRDLNPTAYTRLAALGNRIKPTIVEMKSPEKVSEYEQEIEKLKTENEALKVQQQNDHERLSLLDKFIRHVNDRGYINFNSYKKDESLMRELANYKNE
ncbi:plasmid mobilization protein [Staphylococcus xylosus]|uniref:plasmid mobilization protein n=1 Tax=Staphylococcus xylosus TaxID=1288 RepID=UPI003CF92191